MHQLDISDYEVNLENALVSYSDDYYSTIASALRQYDKVLEGMMSNQLSFEETLFSFYNISRIHADALYVLDEREIKSDRSEMEEQILSIYEVLMEFDEEKITGIFNEEIMKILDSFSQLKENEIDWLEFVYKIRDIAFINISAIHTANIYASK